MECSKCDVYREISAARGSTLGCCVEVVNGAEVDWRGSFGKTLQAAFQVGYSRWYSYPFLLLAVPAVMMCPWLGISKHEVGGPSRNSVKEHCKLVYHTSLRG